MSHAPRGETQKAHDTVSDNDKSCNVKDSSSEHQMGENKAKVNTVPTLVSATSLSNFSLTMQVNSVQANCLVDTGAAVSLISKSLWEKLSPRPLLNKPDQELVGVQGAPLKLLGACTVEVMFNGVDKKFLTGVCVAETITTELILGRDFLQKYNCTVEMGTINKLNFGRDDLTVEFGREDSQKPAVVAKVSLDQAVSLPPYSECELMVKVPVHSSNSSTWLVESVSEKRSVDVARALVVPTEGKIPIRLLNSRSEPLELARGKTIATMESIPDQPLGDSVSAVGNKPGATHERQQRLWEMVLDTGTKLTDEERQQMYCVLVEYADVFADQPDDFGRTSKLKHSINTGDAQPIRQQVRRIPPYRREEARKLLSDMLSKEVIQPSGSPWASPIVLVSKKDGSIRFCVDYRKVNGITRKDAYPLPRVDDTLDTLSGSKWFSTLDLISGYWQVEVEEKDREKTAFCTPDGLFEFKVMPFGLCNAPATFQRLMDMVLAGLQWTNCLVYLDDIIVIGKTFPQHLHNLTKVLERLRNAGLKLQPKKCCLCSKQVEFLGHIVSPNGVSTDPKKIDKVANWPIPSCKREVQQFLGLANYYRRFVADFAKIAKPLHKLTEKTATFTWDDECQTSFERLRSSLVTAPILAFPDLDKPFILDTDASDVGIGAVLSQKDDGGDERVVAYASKSLSRAEQHYCATRRELLAVVTFIRHFRPYLLGRRFTLRTDHGSLTWLAQFKEPVGQLARWLEQLQEFDFEICHRPGKKHQNADAMSRIPCRQCGRSSHETGSVENLSVGAVTLPHETTLQERTPAEIRTLQLQDDSIGFIMTALESGQKPTSVDVKGKGRYARRLYQLWNRLDIKDGTLHRLYEDCSTRRKWYQLVLPPSLRQEVMQEIHAGVISGHLGEQKTLEQLKERVYWPAMTEDVKHWCQTCPVCATRKSPTPNSRAPMQTVQAGYPMQVVAVDITGPFPDSDARNRYILVVGDYFTKWVEAYAIPDQEARTVANKLVDEFFCRYSPRNSCILTKANSLSRN